jgi:hypothetical protein
MTDGAAEGGSGTERAALVEENISAEESSSTTAVAIVEISANGTAPEERDQLQRSDR